MSDTFKTILLVEDDRSLGETLRDRLQKEYPHYEVLWVRTHTQALQALQKNCALILLDVGLPDGDGFSLAEAIVKKNRATNTPTPFLFLTASSDAESRLKGFELGADEFIPKPFHLKELLMRIEHVLKSHVHPHAISSKVETSFHIIDFTGMSIQRKKDGSVEFLASNDMKILKILIEKSPAVVSRDEILDCIWGVDKNANHRSIDNKIVRLRQILSKNCAKTEDSTDASNDAEEYIRSVRGIGYQWKENTYEHKI